jgi:hypothetical protein
MWTRVNLEQSSTARILEYFEDYHDTLLCVPRRAGLRRAHELWDDVTSCRLHVMSNNAAVRFYKRHGFEVAPKPASTANQ